MSEHTKEPVGDYGEPWFFERAGKDEYRINYRDPGSGFTAQIAETYSQERACRIVACVNACAGMGDPEDEIDALRARAEKAEAALDQILSISAGETTMGMIAITNIAREALTGKGK